MPPCGTTIHPGQAGQSVRIQVTGGPKTVEGFLTSSNSAAMTVGTTVRFTDGQLRSGQPIPLAAGFTYHLVLRRNPAIGMTNVQFTDPGGVVIPCANAGPTIGTWIFFA